MRTEPINWPAVVKSWSVGQYTHALCCCPKCPGDNEPPKPLCGFQASPTTVGVMGRLPDCPSCVSVLRDPARHAEHDATRRR